MEAKRAPKYEFQDTPESGATAQTAPTPAKEVYNVPDTPETLARWVWCNFVGITEPYDKEYVRLFDRIEALNRQAFTAGLREAMRQFKEDRRRLVEELDAFKRERAARLQMKEHHQRDYPE